MGCVIVVRELWGLDSLVEFLEAFLSAWVLAVGFLGLALVCGIVMRAREIVGLWAAGLWRASCGG